MALFLTIFQTHGFRGRKYCMSKEYLGILTRIASYIIYTKVVVYILLSIRTYRLLRFWIICLF